MSEWKQDYLTFLYFIFYIFYIKDISTKNETKKILFFLKCERACKPQTLVRPLDFSDIFIYFIFLYPITDSTVFLQQIRNFPHSNADIWYMVKYDNK